MRVAVTEPVKDRPPLSMFGSPVVYVDPSDAKSFRFTKVTLTSDKSATVELRYPRQGLVGHVKFTHDPQAGWTRKNGKSRFGYKAHAAVDEGSGLVRAAIAVPA